jgi:NADH:ubiquinone oxidoreductase subunit H
MFLLNFQWNGYFFLSDIEINIIYMLSFSVLSNFFIFLTGYFCKNKYTIITSSRTVSIIFINEILLTLIICYVFYISKSFTFSNYITNTDSFFGIFMWILFLPVLILIFLVEVNKVPFDFQEAESELIMGFTNEYTGFLFGTYVLIEYIHIFVYSFFLGLLLI